MVDVVLKLEHFGLFGYLIKTFVKMLRGRKLKVQLLLTETREVTVISET